MPKPSGLHSGQECGHVEAACAVSAKVREARAHAGHYGRGMPSQPPHVGTCCLDQGDAEVDSTEGAINHDDLMKIMITVRMRLALKCCGWCCRDALVEGRGRGRGHGQCATSVHGCNKCGCTKTEREGEREREKQYGRGPHRSAPQCLRVTSARSEVWGHASQEASRPCRRRWIGPDVARLTSRAMMPSIHPTTYKCDYL